MKVFEYIHPKNKYVLRTYLFSESFAQKPEDFLSQSELQDLTTFTDENRRKQFLQSRYYLKQNLSPLLKIAAPDIQFKKIGEGKPILNLENKSVDFNLSHSDELCLIGLSECGSIGVDLEKIRRPRNLEQISESFFAPSERSFLLSISDPMEQEQAFMKLWSGKEALIKAAAGGVFRNVHEVIINCEQWSIQNLPSSFGAISQWELQFFTPLDGYIVSAAFRSENK